MLLGVQSCPLPSSNSQGFLAIKFILQTRTCSLNRKKIHFIKILFSIHNKMFFNIKKFQTQIKFLYKVPFGRNCSPGTLTNVEATEEQ